MHVVDAVIEADNTESDENCPLFVECAFVSDQNDAANHLPDPSTRSFSAFRKIRERNTTCFAIIKQTNAHSKRKNSHFHDRLEPNADR
jgi:hypothetical protein